MFDRGYFLTGATGVFSTNANKEDAVGHNNFGRYRDQNLSASLLDVLLGALVTKEDDFVVEQQGCGYFYHRQGS